MPTRKCGGAQNAARRNPATVPVGVVVRPLLAVVDDRGAHTVAQVSNNMVDLSPVEHRPTESVQHGPLKCSQMALWLVDWVGIR